METIGIVGLVGGLVAIAVIMPAVIFFCGARQKQEAPVGASMANRRGGQKGRLQIDPLLQPQWAAKQAERDAQLRQQQAVVLSSKNLRPGVKGSGGNGDDKLHVVLRQPSTMADKYALPSHLTKQLGQPSRRAIPAGNPVSGRLDTPSQEGETRLDLPSQSPPLQRPEAAYTSDSFSATGASRAHRSAGNDVSTQGTLPGGEEGYFQDEHGRTLAAHPTSSRRFLTEPSLVTDQESEAVATYGGSTDAGRGPSQSRRQLGGSGEGEADKEEILREADDVYDRPPGRQSPAMQTSVSIAWRGAINNEVSVGGRSADSPPAGGSTAAAMASRPSHPRITALSPLRSAAALGSPEPLQDSGSGIRSRAEGTYNYGSGSGSGNSRVLLQQLQQQQQSGSCSDAVEQLVQGVDWTAAALGESPESGRRVSSALGLARSLSAAAPREQSSAPPSRDADIERPWKPATVHGEVMRVAAGGGTGARSAGGAASLGERGVSRALSSRDGFPRAASHLDSPQVGPFRWGSTSGRWVVNGGRDGSGNGGSGNVLVSGVGSSGHKTSLPGSTDGEYAVPAGLVTETYAPVELFYRPPLPASQPITQRSRGLSFGTERAAAAAGQAIPPVRSSSGGGGGGRSTATWSGMAGAPLVDVEAGPGCARGAADAGSAAATGSVSGSRAARAQALLSRNKSTLSRLAASASADTVVRP